MTGKWNVSCPSLWKFTPSALAKSFNRLMETSIRCSSTYVLLLVQVLILLRGDEDNVQSVKESQKQTHRRTYSEELFDAQEYNSTRYLSDISRFKEIALGS